jgi:5-methylcytosine-specific restriction enzyme subunit McrC
VKIPIQNIYYLLCYAWNRLDEAEIVGVDVEPETQLLDLLAKVLANGVNHVVRRGLDRGYVLHEELIPGIKGKLLFAPTIRELPRRSGKTYCAFDDLSHDVLTNQIIKATISSLLLAKDLSSENRKALFDIGKRLAWVTDIDLASSVFRRVQLHRNNAFYGFLIDVCAIIHENLLPADSSGEVRFRDFTRDEAKMAMLFQHFLYNFLDREQQSFKIDSYQLKWDSTGSTSDVELLPVMQTDIVAWNNDRCVVMDTKYYGEALQSGQYKTTVRSDHLYQLYSYLRHIRSKVDKVADTCGMLVYPTVERSLKLKYVIDGYAVEVRTLNLDQPWQGVSADALKLLQTQEDATA